MLLPHSPPSVSVPNSRDTVVDCCDSDSHQNSGGSSAAGARKGCKQATLRAAERYALGGQQASASRCSSRASSKALSVPAFSFGEETANAEAVLRPVLHLVSRTSLTQHQFACVCAGYGAVRPTHSSPGQASRGPPTVAWCHVINVRQIRNVKVRSQGKVNHIPRLGRPTLCRELEVSSMGDCYRY